MGRFGGDQRDFYGWVTRNSETQSIHSQSMCRNLRYQIEDISSFIELFEERKALCAQFETVRSRNVNWRKLADLDYQFQPHQATQRAMDMKQEKSMRRLLVLMTAVILHYDVPTLWTQIIADWNQTMSDYARRQLMAFQTFYAEIDHGDGSDDDEKDDSLAICSETEEYGYEPVFDENDSRKYSHNHLVATPQ